MIVNATVARVFAAFMDWESQSEWIPFTKVRVVEGDGGEGSLIEAVTGFGPAALREGRTADADVLRRAREAAVAPPPPPSAAPPAEETPVIVLPDVVPPNDKKPAEEKPAEAEKADADSEPAEQR